MLVQFIQKACMAAVCCATLVSSAQSVYTVQTGNIQAKVSPTLWGLFFEDINRGADGGVYAEMVENRSFDFPKPMRAWSTWSSNRLRDGIFIVTNEMAKIPADPKYMTVTTRATDTVGLINGRNQPIGHTHKAIPGSYVEFAERRVLPKYRDLPAHALTDAHRREGFEAGNADKIFESTYLAQTNKSSRTDHRIQQLFSLTQLNIS